MDMPEQMTEALLSTVPYGSELCMHQVFGRSVANWKVWKCNRMPDLVLEAMQAQSSFRWPLWPVETKAVGLEVPDQKLPFCVAPDIDGHPIDDEESDGEAVGGQSGFQYDAVTLLKFLRFQSMLKPGTDVRSAFALAVELSGHDPEPVLDTEVTKVPSLRTLQRTLVRLDITMMHWARHLWNNGYQAAMSLMADSSEQNKIDLFCQRADYLALHPTDRVGEQHIDVTRRFQRCIVGLSVL